MNRIASIDIAKPADPASRRIAVAFTGRLSPAPQAVAAIYRELGRKRASTARLAWESVARLLGTKPPAADSPHIVKLAAAFDLETAHVAPERLLFAMQSYYALVVSALVAHVLKGCIAIDKLLPADDLYNWPGRCDAPDIQDALGAIRQCVAQFPAEAIAPADGGGDLLADLYQSLFPRAIRHALGEYYTPSWLADHVLDQAGYQGSPQERLLDPSCGSGVFLIRAIHRAKAWHAAHHATSGWDDAAVCRAIVANIVGYDLNPLAALSTRANYLLALGDLAKHLGDLPLPILLGDSILGDREEMSAAKFDCVVGNPPWIAWDNLPADYREATKPLWQHYGLFSLSGNAARHGGGKKDLSMLMVYVAADRYLKRSGRLAMVLTQTLLQTKGAGDGFRKFRLGAEGEWLKVLRADDLVQRKPFDDAANWTCTLVLEKGAPTEYPVPYVKWPATDAQSAGDAACRLYAAEPVERSRTNSPWFLRPRGLAAKLEELIGPSDYTARLGANSGGANSVYWVQPLARRGNAVRICNLAETGRTAIDKVECEVEASLLYPLMRWGDVAAFHAEPSAAILMSQDPATRVGIAPEVMQAEYPLALSYLERFEPLLFGRAAYRRYQSAGPFWSMYNIGPYTIAPTKVVWRRMDRRIRAAVVEPIDDPLLGVRPVVPQETCVFVAVESADEAHYLCALLNSAVVNFLASAHSVGGGKGFGTPSILDFLRLRRFEPGDARHRSLAALSEQAHRRAVLSQNPSHENAILHEINRLAGNLWELAPDELAAIEREVEPR